MVLLLKFQKPLHRLNVLVLRDATVAVVDKGFFLFYKRGLLLWDELLLLLLLLILLLLALLWYLTKVLYVKNLRLILLLIYCTNLPHAIAILYIIIVVHKWRVHKLLLIPLEYHLILIIFKLIPAKRPLNPRPSNYAVQLLINGLLLRMRRAALCDKILWHLKLLTDAQGDYVMIWYVQSLIWVKRDC